MIPNLLLQKFPAPNFTASTKISLFPEKAETGKTAGIIVMGTDYATLSITHDKKGYIIKQTEAINAINGSVEIINFENPCIVYLKSFKFSQFHLILYHKSGSHF